MYLWAFLLFSGVALYAGHVAQAEGLLAYAIGLYMSAIALGLAGFVLDGLFNRL